MNAIPPFNPARPSSRIIRHSAAGLLLGASLLAASPAAALDATDFFKGLQAEAEKNGNSLTWQSLESTGGDGARALDLVLENGKTGERMTIGEMMLSGTEVIGEDGFSFATMEAIELALQVKGKNASDDRGPSTLTIDRLSAEDFNFPPMEDRERPFWPFDMASGEATGVRIVSSGRQSVALNLPSVRISGLKHQGGDRNFTLDSFASDAATGSVAEDEKGGTFHLGEISVKGFSLFGEAGYKADSARFDGLRINGTDEKGRDFKVDVGEFSAANVFGPDFGADGNLVFPEEAMTATMGSVTFSLDGTEMARLAGGSSTAHFDDETKEYVATGSFKDLYIAVSEFPVEPGKDQGRKQFEALGYDSINMDIDIEAGWNVESGDLSISSYRFAADEMMVLDLGLSLAGYTVDFARNLQKISMRMNSATDEETRQALSFQLLAEMSELEVKDMRIRLDDKSLMGRIMEMQAAQSGQKKEDMLAAVPFMVGAMMAPLDVPQFASSVSAAVGRFLQTSGSLTLTAKPDEPVSFAEVMGIAAGVKAGNIKPADVIDRFNVEISAP